MSDCGCKNSQNDLTNLNQKNDETLVVKGNSYIFNFFLFIIATIILPFTLPLMIIVLFKTIVLNNSINLMPILIKIGKIFKIKEKEIIKDNIELINEEELELVGVDIIKK